MIKKNYKNIEEFNKDQNLPEPQNPLFSINNIKWDSNELNNNELSNNEISYTNQFYVISLKEIISGEIIYGRTKYDCTKGTMFFWSPNQKLVTKDIVVSKETWLITFHDEFIKGLDIRKRIKNYNFFNYNVNEALHLSPNEEKTVISIFKNIKAEYNNNKDKFSKDIIISHLETLLIYCDRFYQRQFIDREHVNKSLVEDFNNSLNKYFDNDLQSKYGLPTISWLAKELNVSNRYISDAIKSQTGKTAIDQIHTFLVEEAKNLLLSPNATVYDTAYKLGFDYPQYFSRLFKKKTGTSPKEYINISKIK